ncbi:Gamma-glutamyltranspeptidase @ Glutathione hydrolase [hydrothermal vent metagenome]|uniref:Gamma-glutamyltranspeptidase @ Glutathione hydrolase n=1 Tax=hydrothermal vent metagenome TaxID=652676 RepID=A0A3B0RS69_9ZZZZ
MKKLYSIFCGLIMASLSLYPVQATENAAIIQYNTRHHPVIGKMGMVVSQRAVASQVGADILKGGGNAVDAAVAVGFALAVTLPRAGNLGGGGFMLVHLAKENKTIALDYREMAPAAAHRDMFLDRDGNVDEQKARFSLLSAGVPGTVAGLSFALEHYGTMTLSEVIEPAIQLAKQGITVSYDLSERIKERSHLRTPSTCKIYFKKGCIPYEAGERLVQKDLAWSLRQIQENGPDAFYKGAIARKITQEMKRNGGLITMKDLAAYHPVMRKPVSGHFKGYEVVSMPPPSSGGVHIIQMLNILDHFPLKDSGPNSAAALHYLTETMKRAYADRSKYLGDPDHVTVPVKGLVSRQYAAALAGEIRACCVTPSDKILPGAAPEYESPDTTHFSVMDRWGNAVSNTYTLNFSFGSGHSIPGTGILMNNEMDDFSAKPGVPNAFGLLGAAANAIAPGKRPLSSMTPTIIFKDDKPYLVTGSPGGSRIITTVLQMLVNVLIHDMNVAEATHTPRIHHQWYPDILLMEPGFSPDTIKMLRDMGYNVSPSGTMGSLQSIQWKNGFFFGASDPRRPGAAAIAY